MPCKPSLTVTCKKTLKFQEKMFYQNLDLKKNPHTINEYDQYDTTKSIEFKDNER